MSGKEDAMEWKWLLIDGVIFFVGTFLTFIGVAEQSDGTTDRVRGKMSRFSAYRDFVRGALAMAVGKVMVYAAVFGLPIVAVLIVRPVAKPWFTRATPTPTIYVAPPVYVEATVGAPTVFYPADQCVNRMQFISDVTVPDNTVVQPAAAFVKIWRLKNTGTCLWDESYSIVPVGGEAMQGVPAQLGGRIGYDQAVDASILLVAPSRPGIYTGEWMLKGPKQIFGLGPRGDKPFWVKIIVR